MITHDDALRLAAIDIDFPLEARDRTRLAEHLAGCAACRRAAASVREVAADLAAISVMPAPARVRTAVAAAATQGDEHPRFGWFGLSLGLPAGVTMLLLVALLVALLAAGLAGGGGRRLAAVVPVPTAPPAAPVASDPPSATIARSVSICPLATDLVAAGNALWFLCHDGSVWRMPLSGGAPVRVAASVLALAPDDRGVWAVQADSISELDAATGTPSRRLAGVGGDAAGTDGRTLTVVDATSGVAHTVDVSRSRPRLLASIAIGSEPLAAAVLDGSGWATVLGDRSLVRLDPSGKSITTRIPVGQEPRRVISAGGRLWVANDADGTVTMVDPATNLPTTIPVDPAVNSSLLPAIAADAGQVWVTDSHRVSLFEIALDSGTVTGELHLPLHGLVAAVAVADGSLWVVDDAGYLDLVQDPR